jgi:hypothetical protein
LSTSLESIVDKIAGVINKYAVPKLFQLNGFTDIIEYPTITPGQIETPTVKEIALLLRAMGLDISEDMELMNYLRKIASMPEMTKDLFNKVYKNQKAAKVNDTQVKVKDTQVKAKDGTEQKPDDTAENDFEQNDLDYTGQ